MFLYGESGVGKTHLVQAIGAKAKAVNPKARVLYLSSHLFQVQYTNAVRSNSVNDFINFYQSIDVLLIDDIQDLVGKTATQNTFFHIFNHLHQTGKQLVLTSDRPPVSLEGMEERLLTRFKWGLSAEVERPDYDLRKNIFFWKYNNFIGYAKVGAGPGSFGQTPDPDNREYYYFCYAMYYPGTRLGVSDNWLLRTAEAYLNGAEAAAYLGDERTARELLEALRVKRWDREKYEPIQKTGEALVTEIRDERRRELCLEGHRWFDLRRYMVCEKYPFTKEIQKVYYVYDDSGNQIIEKRVYKLEKNDPAYTLPIPYEVLDYNTGMEDNPHPQRSYVSEPFN